jgi:flagellar hook assembly protein FlgD
VWCYDSAYTSIISSHQQQKEQNILHTSPNPFTNELYIHFETPGNQMAQVSIYDMQGNLIRILNSKKLSHGYHELIWNGKDNNGREVQYGLYLMRLQSGRKVYVKKVLRMNQ